MGKRLNFWPLAGFLTVSVLGTLAHFAYEWSGKQLLAGAFCAVNESTWEHMKLLFFPALLFTMIQIGILGRHVLWADIAIFYLAAALTFRLDSCLRRRRRLWEPWQQAAGLLWLWGLAFLFVWWTFRPPHIGLFLDPATGGYGIA